MPDHAALSNHRGRTGALLTSLVLIALAAGCAQPGTQAPKPQAAKLAVGTSDISAACGYLEELSGSGPSPSSVPASIESMAETGARKLAGVYDKDQTGIYQGDSVGAVLGDSISLLHDCGLAGPERILQRALRTHG